MDSQVFTVLMLTGGAGAITVLGAALVLFSSKLYKKISALLPVSLGFAAGLMIFIAMADMIPESFHMLEDVIQEYGHYIAVVGVGIGILLLVIIDMFVPHIFHLHGEEADHNHSTTFNTGATVALAVGMHNIPEGFAVAVASYNDISLSAALAIAIALHNFPIGVAIAGTMLEEGRSKLSALYYAAGAGSMQLVGAIVGTALHGVVTASWISGLLFAIGAGLIIYLSFDELLPAAYARAGSHAVLLGILTGIVVMLLVSLWGIHV